MIVALNLLNEVADRAGYPQIETLEVAEYTAETRKLVRLLNRVLETTGGLNDWPQLRTESTIVTLAQVEGSADDEEYVTATQNSQTITVQNVTSFDQTYLNRAVQVSGDEYIYRIIEVPSSGSLKLNRAWVNSSIAVSDEKTLTITMDKYALEADFDRAIDNWQGFFAPYNIEPVTPNEFRARRRARNTMRVADPEVFTVYGTQNGRQVVHFDPYPENARMLQYEYQKRHPEINSDNDVIHLPHTYYGALIDVMLHLINRDYDDNAKMEVVLRDALRSHNLALANQGVTESHLRLVPANSVRRSMREAYGLVDGNVDWGDYFDMGWTNGIP
jgi:hypothetical protein